MASSSSPTSSSPTSSSPTSSSPTSSSLTGADRGHKPAAARFKHYVLNYKREPDDARDHVFSLHLAAPGGRAPSWAARTLPASVDLRDAGVPVLDQGAFGSCTANASTTGMWLLHADDWSSHSFVPSTMYQYCNTRMFERSGITVDGGATLRGACRSLNKFRLCASAAWSYSGAHLVRPPSLAAYASAAVAPWDAAMVYAKITDNNLTAMKTALAAGQPIVFGALLFSSFYDAADNGGIVAVPNTALQTFAGAHAMCIVGYDDATQRFTVRNSWGTEFGDGGDVYMPYAYLSNAQLVFDMWALSTGA